jgi:hypothetical protein
VRLILVQFQANNLKLPARMQQRAVAVDPAGETASSAVRQISLPLAHQPSRGPLSAGYVPDPPVGGASTWGGGVLGSGFGFSGSPRCVHR